jgi:hypothetical protein
MLRAYVCLSPKKLPKSTYYLAFLFVLWCYFNLNWKKIISHLNIYDERLNKLDLLLVFFCLHFPLVASIGSNFVLHLFRSVLHQIERIYEYIKLNSWLHTLSVTWIDSLNRLKIRAMFTILIHYLLLMQLMANSSFNFPKRLICSSILLYESYQNPIRPINNY